MTLDQDPLAHLARLAGLDLEATERAELGRRLQTLQSLVRALPPLDPGVDDAATAPPLPLRTDRPLEPLPVEAALRSAPARQGDWLDCPTVLEDDG